jgi:hypothetical protein
MPGMLAFSRGPFVSVGNAVTISVLFMLMALVKAQDAVTVAPGWAAPRTANKLLKYNDAYLQSSGGTCNYGPTFGNQGVVVAANTAFYSDDVSQLYHHDGQSGSPPTKGDGCGICYNFTRTDGQGGSGVGVIADICDDENACTQFINGYSFNLYYAGASPLWQRVMGAGEGRGTINAPTAVTLQKVSCPNSVLTGNDLT